MVVLHIAKVLQQAGTSLFALICLYMTADLCRVRVKSGLSLRLPGFKEHENGSCPQEEGAKQHKSEVT